MKAILTKCNVSNAINYSGKKELTNHLKLVAIKKGEISELIDCSFYMSRADLTRADLTDANLRGADLTRVLSNELPKL